MSGAPNHFRSDMPGLRFPALPGAQGAGVLALQYQYAQSQRASPARLRERQFAQIAALLDHCLDAVPFHAARLQRAGYRRGRALEEEIWRRIPVLTRREVQDAGAALQARRDPEGHGERISFDSSGSTGRPVTGVQSQLFRLYFDSITLRDHLWHARDLAARLGVIRYAGSLALHEGRGSMPGWNSAAAAAFENGPSFLCDINRPIGEQVDWLFEVRPDYLLTNPSLLRELVRETLRRGVHVDWLRGVRTFAEVLDGGLRDYVHEHWRVAIADIYSATEAGYIALQCPEGTNYHVQSEVCLVEILDEAGRECAPGETGRVVVTPLHNFAMPLLRYELGDYAEVGDRCRCGRTLPLLRRVLGRARNSFRRRDGSRFWPAGISLAEELVRQFQVVEVAPWQVEARLVTTRPLSAAERDDAAASLARTLKGEYAVRIVEVEAIARSPSGKYEDFVALPPAPSSPSGKA